MKEWKQEVWKSALGSQEGDVCKYRKSSKVLCSKHIFRHNQRNWPPFIFILVFKYKLKADAPEEDKDFPNLHWLHIFTSLYCASLVAKQGLCWY